MTIWARACWGFLVLLNGGVGLYCASRGQVGLAGIEGLLCGWTLCEMLR